jgi:3-oxoacyl-[acyl-carrier protein] reductase
MPGQPVVDSDFSGRTAVITGGARGFGRAFAQAFIERSATVALIDVDRDAVQKTARKLGPLASAYAGDVTDEVRMSEIMGEIAASTGSIDILVNNAGLHSQEYSRPLKELGIGKIRRLFDVNAMGIVIGTFAAVPYMANRPGANIVNIASSSAYLPGGYGVSKLAAIGLTITFARELSDDEIRVNAIAPGVILTQTIETELPAETLQRIKAMQYVKRHGEEDDIVNAMLYLASNKARFVTGETLRVTGGFTPGI